MTIYNKNLDEDKNIENDESNIHLLLSKVFSNYPDISEEDEDYLNGLNYEELIAEIKNRGWEAILQESAKVEIIEDASQVSGVASGINGQISVFGNEAGNKFIKHSSEDIYKELFELKDYDPEEEHNIYTCMDCGNEFEDSQVYITDADGNPSCPFCRSGDVSKYED